MPTPIVPSQEKGKSVDLKEEVIAGDEPAAKELFKTAVDRLCIPSLWHEVAGTLSASFTVDGKKENDSIEPGDHIRISIPGPGLGEGDGDDWVIVDSKEIDFNPNYDESFGITLAVCPNPHTPGDAVAHFFAGGASSTFLLTRNDLTVTAHYFGRNEVPNTEGLSITDTVRNIVVAGGALAGMSELQWTALLKGLLTSGKS